MHNFLVSNGFPVKHLMNPELILSILYIPIPYNLAIIPLAILLNIVAKCVVIDLFIDPFNMCLKHWS